MKFTIDRLTWGRGGTGGRLLDLSNGLMCCLGQIGLQCGVPKDQLEGLGSPNHVKDNEKYPVAIVDNVDYPDGDGGTTKFAENTDLADRMMRVNDSRLISEEEREEKLITIAAEKDIELVFIN